MAGFADIDLTEEAYVEENSIAKLFTDREEPQEAFERKLRAFAPYRKKAYGVLGYYGIGGIGKTSLKNRLAHLLDGDENVPKRIPDSPSAYHVSFDFGEEGITTDKRTFLTRLRNQIVILNKDFQFYLFDMALIALAKKSGIDIYKDETASLCLNQNEWLNSLVTLCGALPVGGWVSNAIQGLDQFIGKVKQEVDNSNIKKKYAEYVRDICSDEPAEILKKLHIYFSIDLKQIMTEKADKPLVVFVDTYEKFIDTLNSDTLKLIDDYWLRKGPSSVIRSIPGVLWVILGREKLTWTEDDPTWGECTPDKPLDKMSEEEKEQLAANYILEQHVLGDLSELDTLKYLGKAGITDEKLGKDIYKLTNGTPLFLDMCVRQYNSIKSVNQNITISDFGKNLDELISRYLQNMPAHYREMSYVLALMGEWTDEKIYEVVEKVSLIKEFTKARYDEYLKHSFVIQKENGAYYLHKSVREACLLKANENEPLKKAIGKVLLEMSALKIEDTDNLGYSDEILRFIDRAFTEDTTYEEAYGYVKKVLEAIEKLNMYGLYNQCVQIALALWIKIKAKFSQSSLNTIAVIAYSYAVSFEGRILESYEQVKKYKDFVKPEDIEDETYYLLVFYLSHIFRGATKYQDAYALDKRAFDEICKNGAPSTVIQVKVEQALSNDEFYQGRYESCVAHDEKVYEKFVELLGENHPETLEARRGYAVAISYLGRKQETLAIIKEVYEKSCIILGKTHRRTLKTLRNLGEAYKDLGNYDECFKIYEQSYNTCKENLGEKNPETVDALNALRIGYNLFGKYEEALKIAQQVYEFRKEIYGYNNIRTADAKSAISGVLINLGRYKEALEIDEEVYEQKKKALGEDHPSTLSALAAVADTYDDLGMYEKALEILLKVYEKRKEIFGENSLVVIRTLNSISVVYNRLKRYEESFEADLKVYEARLKLLGENHPDTILSLDNLAIAYSNIGEVQKSLDLHIEAYEKRKKILGEKHPQTIKSKQSIAITYSILGDDKKAFELDKEVYQARKEVLGENHPETLKTLSCLGVDYYNLGQYDKAIELGQKVYEGRIELLGKTHNDTLVEMKKLASRYSKVGNHKKALELYLELLQYRLEKSDGKYTLEICSLMLSVSYQYSSLKLDSEALEIDLKLYEARKELLGEKHLDTIQTLSYLGDDYDALGNKEEALKFFEKVYALRREVLGEEHEDTLKAKKNIEKIRKILYSNSIDTKSGFVRF